MREYAHSIGEFASWRGDQQKRARFLERLVNIIKTRTLHGFATAVMMDAYREVDKRYRLSEVHPPFALAGIACIDKVRRWATEMGIPQQQIAYIFEDGDKNKDNLVDAVKQQFRFVPIFAAKDACCALQAADLLAYEHLLANRRIYKSGPGTLGLSDMRKPLQALDDIPHTKDGEDWGVFERTVSGSPVQEKRILLPTTVSSANLSLRISLAVTWRMWRSASRENERIQDAESRPRLPLILGGRPRPRVTVGTSARRSGIGA